MVKFFGLASKSSLFLSFLSDLLPASPGMKSKPKICWEMGRATADLCKSNFFKARANRRVPTLCIAETYDAIQGMNSPWCNLILNPVFLFCVRGWRRQTVVQIINSRHKFHKLHKPVFEIFLTLEGFFPLKFKMYQPPFYFPPPQKQRRNL